jgi:hypothetical protein
MIRPYESVGYFTLHHFKPLYAANLQMKHLPELLTDTAGGMNLYKVLTSASRLG